MQRNTSRVTYNPDEMARVCHDTIRALQGVHHEQILTGPWECEPVQSRAIVISGICAVLEGADPPALHEQWVQHKTNAGWVYGEERDTDARTHPNLVPWAELDPAEQMKTRVFHAIVLTMRGDTCWKR